MFVLVMFLCSSIYYIHVYIYIYIAVVHLQVGITVDSEDPLTGDRKSVCKVNSHAGCCV